MKLIPILAVAAAGYYAYQAMQKRRSAPRRKALARFPDDAVTRRIIAALEQDGALPGSLNVRVLDGTAILSGSVSHADRDRVLRKVLATDGVRSVRNELAVEGGAGQLADVAPT